MGALILKGDRVLLVQRGRSPLKGYWSLPGGLLETGEHLAIAVCREVLEETGLTVKPLAVVEVFERIMRDGEGKAEYHYVLVDYLCKVTGGELQPADDAQAAEWVRRKELAARKLTDGTLGVIERAFERRAAMAAQKKK